MQPRTRVWRSFAGCSVALACMFLSEKPLASTSQDLRIGHRQVHDHDTVSRMGGGDEPGDYCTPIIPSVIPAKRRLFQVKPAIPDSPFCTGFSLMTCYYLTLGFGLARRDASSQ